MPDPHEVLDTNVNIELACDTEGCTKVVQAKFAVPLQPKFSGGAVVTARFEVNYALPDGWLVVSGLDAPGPCLYCPVHSIPVRRLLEQPAATADPQ